MHATRRGFTLLEIMVVVSIMSMLSSVVLASVGPARANARDSQRTQQYKQIDLAIQLYKSDHGGQAPDLQGSCAAQAEIVDPSVVSGCIAVSTSAVGSLGATAWQSLKDDLAPYISTIPDDPCGSNCQLATGSYLGYTYYSPLAYQYTYCDTGTCNQSTQRLNENYQLTVQLERQGSGVGSSPLPSITVDVEPNQGPDGPVVLSWSSTNSTSCILLTDADKDLDYYTWDFYSGFIGQISSSGSIVFSELVPVGFIVTCNGSGGTNTAFYDFIGF